MRNDPHDNPPPGRPTAPPQQRPQLGVETCPVQAPHAVDHWRVDLQQDWEIVFWSREFRCSEEALRRAVQHVGNKAGAVRAHLAKGSR